MKININHGQSSALVIRVDIPALTDLVAFLRDGEQAEIDASTTKLAAAARRLNAVKDSLTKAVQDEKK